MIELLNNLSFFVFLLFFACYSYQFVYIGVRCFKKMPKREAKKLHRYAAVVAARNESAVISELIDSLRAQNYPAELLDIYIVADNCTDDTAAVCRAAGAFVFERNNLQQVGKGYALNHAFEQIEAAHGLDHYDGFMVFDADNVLDPNYVREINTVFDQGYEVVTSYRNSKNYGYNWISAGYALWFLRESKYLNGARMLCRTSCAISGTGFLVASKIIQEDGGWKYHMMTEDIEFTVANVIRGHRIGYCESAILYDEQPIDFKTSWHQRMRWTKGFYQVLYGYGLRLLRGCGGTRGFSCFDMLATITPTTMLTLVLLLMNGGALLFGLADGSETLVMAALLNIWATLRNMYLSLFIFGLITIITEWKKIHSTPTRKILYLFTFPIFIFTYLPIGVATLFRMKRVTWVPIRHSFVGTNLHATQAKQTSRSA